MKNDKKIIGQRISSLRKINKLSQEQLADISKIHRTYISQIERGIKSPTLSILFRILKSINIKPSSFFKGIENEL